VYISAGLPKREVDEKNEASSERAIGNTDIVP